MTSEQQSNEDFLVQKLKNVWVIWETYA